MSIAIHCLSGVFALSVFDVKTWSGRPLWIVIQAVALVLPAGCTATEIVSGGCEGFACFEPLLKTCPPPLA